MTAAVSWMPTSATPQVPTDLLPGRSGCPTILVVDDDDDIRDFAAVRLQFAGYHVITAKDGNDALAIARQRRPDLVVLDVWMPGMDGIDVCYELRADSDTVHIPVLM